MQRTPSRLVWRWQAHTDTSFNKNSFKNYKTRSVSYNLNIIIPGTLHADCHSLPRQELGYWVVHWILIYGCEELRCYLKYILFK